MLKGMKQYVKQNIAFGEKKLNNWFFLVAYILNMKCHNGD